MTGDINGEVPVKTSGYFLEQLREEYLLWPEKEIFIEVGRQLDRDKRAEEVATKQRLFWVKELLLNKLWERAKTRRNVRKWSKELIIEEFKKVIVIKSIISQSIDDCVEVIEKQKRLQKVKEVIEKGVARMKLEAIHEILEDLITKAVRFKEK